MSIFDSITQVPGAFDSVSPVRDTLWEPGSGLTGGSNGRKWPERRPGMTCATPVADAERSDCSRRCNEANYLCVEHCYKEVRGDECWLVARCSNDPAVCDPGDVSFIAQVLKG